jgi:hypothetical protein|tara:strand:- start:222 stop:329 length:108 start_codon:yes stop_codon:yes gene_type:complete
MTHLEENVAGFVKRESGELSYNVFAAVQLFFEFNI